MERHGVERVVIRNQFYWENYRSLALLVILLSFLIVAIAGFAIYQRFTWTKPKYFATTPDGRPIPIVRLDEPMYEDPAFVLEWSGKAIRSIYALDFVSWRKTLQDAEVYFTPKGYQAFLIALKASTNLEALKNLRHIVSIEISAPPKLIRQGQLGVGLPYRWELQMAVIATYQNSENDIIKQNGTISMVVERASLLRHKEGLAIQQLVFQANNQER